MYHKFTTYLFLSNHIQTFIRLHRYKYQLKDCLFYGGYAMSLLRLVTHLGEYLSSEQKVIGSIPILTPNYDLCNPPFCYIQ